MAARSLLPRPRGEQSRGDGAWRYRGVWLLVLLTGMGFGLARVQPIPVIILAQVLNGLLLPLVAGFLFLLVNDVRLMGRSDLNGPVSNAAMAVVVAVTVLLGLLNVSKALASGAGLSPPGEGPLLLSAGLLVLFLAWPVARGSGPGGGSVGRRTRTEEPPCAAAAPAVRVRFEDRILYVGYLLIYVIQ